MSKSSIKSNAVFNAIKTVSSIIFPIITFPYISRTLLPDNIGKINFGRSIVSYFSLIASLGIATHAIRECSGVRNDKNKLNDAASQIFSINLITTCIAYLALGVTLVFCRSLDNYRTLIIIQSLGIVAGTLGADWINSAMEDFKYITIRSVVVQIVSVTLMFLFVHKPEDYMKYAVISLVSSAGANITNIWYRRRYVKTRFTLKIEWRRHFAPIMYLFVMILAQTIYSSVDTTMLGLMHGDYEVGIYNTAHKISNMIFQVIASLLWVIMPRMSYYFSEEKYDEANGLLRKILGFNFLLGLPCVTGCFLLAKDIIYLTAGKEFIESASVLQILIIGVLFSLIGGAYLGNAILLPSKQEKYYMVVCCITAVFNVIGNSIFIPRFGPEAAAGTTAASEFLIFILLLLKVDKNIKIQKIGKLLAGPLVGCAGIIAVCMAGSLINNIWIRVITDICGSVCVYFAVQVILKNELIGDVLTHIRKKISGK